jgi:vacuolar-type H+-ATPase subunit C/Vma6
MTEKEYLEAILDDLEGFSSDGAKLGAAVAWLAERNREIDELRKAISSRIHGAADRLTDQGRP